MSAFHLAGEPEANVQKCRRCGLVLVDYEGAMAPIGSEAGGFFAPNAIIEHEGNGMWLAEHSQAADIRARLCVDTAELPRLH